VVWLFADIANVAEGRIAAVVLDPKGVSVANATEAAERSSGGRAGSNE
jgi:hypothetical protein